MHRHRLGGLHGRTAALALLGVLEVTASCSSQRVTGECAAAVSRAIVVAVRDSTTGAAAANGAFGTIERAGVVDTLFQSDSLLMFGGDRLGTYSVDIERPGYDSWTKAGVDVTQLGSCGNVVPVQLTAKLQPTMP